MELSESAMEAIDSLIRNSKEDLNTIMEEVMPQRTGELHFTMFLGIGLFVNGYTYARLSLESSIQEALQFGMNQMMENTEIQAVLSQMMAEGLSQMIQRGGQ